MAKWQKSQTSRTWHSLPAFRGRERQPTNALGLKIQTLGRTVPADLDLLTPTMQVVVIEDLCWALERDAWLSRRPPWWRFAGRRAWAAQEAALDAKQERLRDMAATD
jgi:hypothetical protein